jgi:uncharacterized membrane protein YkoI
MAKNTKATSNNSINSNNVKHAARQAVMIATVQAEREAKNVVRRVVAKKAAYEAARDSLKANYTLAVQQLAVEYGITATTSHTCGNKSGTHVAGARKAIHAACVALKTLAKPDAINALIAQGFASHTAKLYYIA